jgi:hypothetical protein
MLFTVLKLIGANLIKNNVHGSLLKNIGFGFAATSVQDQLLEQEWRVYDMVALTLGTAAWCGGIYLEKRHARNNYIAPVKLSTAVIKQALSHGSGFGLVTGITHIVKEVDTPSGKFALLNMALVSPAAIMELNRAAIIYPTIPWEKLRLIVLIAGDYFLASGVKSFMNNGNRDTFTILSVVLGFIFATTEAAYGFKYDKGLSFQNILNRRIFKIMAGVNMIFTLLDIINEDNDKYTIADDVYLTACSVLLFMTLLELRAVALRTKNRYDQLLAGYNAREPLPLEEKKEAPVMAEAQEPGVGENAADEQPYTRLEIS